MLFWKSGATALIRRWVKTLTITAPTHNAQKFINFLLLPTCASGSLPLSLVHMSASAIPRLPEPHHDNSNTEHTDVLPSDLNSSDSKTNSPGLFYSFNAQDQAHIFYQVQIPQIAG